MYKKYLCAFTMVLISITGTSQKLIFSDAPEHYRLYARDKSDSAKVLISGKVQGDTDFEILMPNGKKW